MKQKISLPKKYREYLSEQLKPLDKLHDKSNIFDDLNATDNAMMKEAELLMHLSNGAGKSRNKSEELFKEIRRKLCPKIEAVRQLRSLSS